MLVLHQNLIKNYDPSLLLSSSGTSWLLVLTSRSMWAEIIKSPFTFQRLKICSNSMSNIYRYSLDIIVVLLCIRLMVRLLNSELEFPQFILHWRFDAERWDHYSYLKFQAPVIQWYGAKFHKKTDLIILLFVNSDKTIFHGSFNHSIGMCRIWRFLAVLRSFFCSSLLYTFSWHPSPPTILPSSLTSSSLYFLVCPSILIFPNSYTYNTLLGILFSSILCTCPNQCNLFNLIVSIIVGFLTLA